MFSVRFWQGPGYRRVMVSLLATLSGLNVADLVSTKVALGEGLSEGNTVLLGASSLLGTNLIMSLLFFKVVYISGAVAVTVLGMRTRAAALRSRVFALLLVLTVLIGVVVANNIYIIGLS